MEYGESEDILQLRTMLERFVAREMPRELARKWDRDNYFPREVLEKLGSLGATALTVPEEYGGVGRDVLATMIVIEELSRRSLAVAVPYIMSACYAGMNLVECGSTEQKQEMLPKVAAGKLLFAYGWTEPDVGADLASVTTTARIEGDHVVVNGAKRFCSGAAIADYIYALVRTGPAEDRYQNLSFVLIPPTAKGVTITNIEGMGMKGAATTDVILENVELPLSNIVGGPSAINKGWEMLIGPGMDIEKLEVAAIGVGIARASFDDAWEYAQERKQFGKPIANYQSIQHKLARMASEVHTARLSLYHAASRANANLPCSKETSIAKLYCGEVAKSTALESQTIHGAYGYTKEYCVERYVRDALLVPIMGGSTAIQHNNIYKALARERS